MKRKLIKRNKQFLSGLLIKARLNNLSLPMMIDLLNQKFVLNMISRKKLREDWSQAVFGDGFASVPQVSNSGHIICYRIFLDKADLPQEHRSWHNLFDDIESADDNFIIERSNIITGRENIFDE